MKGFIIDSDTWIEYFHQRSGVGAHISQVPRNEIFASEVSIAELTYGALHSSNVEKHMKEPMKLATGTELATGTGDWVYFGCPNLLSQ